MVRLETPVCDFGKEAVDFDLPGVDGRSWTLESCRGPKGLLVMFISNHCPYVKAIRHKLVADAKALQDLGVNSVAIMPNDTVAYPEDSFDNMRRVSEAFDFSFPYLLDETQQVARSFGAVCTPDFFGYNADLQLQYRGRLDASGPGSGDEVYERELFNAMKRVAESGHGPEWQVPSVGCSIKWRDDGASP